MKRGFGFLAAAMLALVGAAPPDQNQVVAPVRTIKGSSTGLAWPSGIAVDRSGAVYVSNDGDLAGTRDAVTIYGPAANGDAAPARTISGDLTGLTRPNGLAVDANGLIYVASVGVTGNGATETGQDR
ncbi:MAG: hypothetical protein JO347_05070, partial [Candidatus Eremiobacteraeota bacterium]|nr:hypothetical protein [Candidatus Eremiobacteraeota bacterium]